ncbi:MAG: TaqI-like C-terminal specificity domain-containing protein, partial [Thermoplasmata archaeon]
LYRKNLEKFYQTKIIKQVYASQNTFAFNDTDQYYFFGGDNAGGYGIVLKEDYKVLYYYVIALLNSKVLEFYLKKISTLFRGGYFYYGRRFIEQLPILIEVSGSINSEIQSICKNQISLSEMLLSSRKIDTDSIIKIKEKIGFNEKRLNDLIYGINGEKIQVIENFIKRT